MDARAVISWNVRRLRVARGLAQEALAIDAQIDRTYVSRVERNMENPTVVVLERLAAALGVRIVDLFEEPKEGEAPPQTLPKGRRRAT